MEASQQIRVVEARRAVVDLTAQPPEEVERLASEDADIAPFVELARLYSGPLTQFLSDESQADGIVSVLLRTVLTNTAYRPRVSEDQRHAVHTRPSARTPALDSAGRPVPLPAEEDALLGELAYRPRMLGAFVAAALAGGLPAGPPAALAASRGPHPPQWPAGEPTPAPLEGESGEELIRKLLRLTRAAVAHYLGAGAARVAAAQEPPSQPFNVAAAVSAEVPSGPTWLTSEGAQALRELVADFAAARGVRAGPELHYYDATALNYLWQMGGLAALSARAAHGPGSAGERALLAAAADAEAARRAQAALDAARARAATRARIYLRVLEDRLRPERLDEIAAALRASGARIGRPPGGAAARAIDAVAVDDPAALFAALTPAERQLAKAEFDARRQLWAATAANPCPHVPLERRMRAVTSAREAAEALAQLEQFAAASLPSAVPGAPRRPAAGRDGGREASWVVCRECGYNLVCPHVVEKLRYLARARPTQDLYQLLAPYMLKVAAAGGYFCRVCGELLFDEDHVGAPPPSRERDSDLRAHVWVTALRNIRWLRFSMPVEPKAFASAAADAIYAHVEAAEQAAGGSRRRRDAAARLNTAAAVSPRAQLITLLYFAAYCVVAAETSDGRVQVAGAERQPPGKAALALQRAIAKSYGALAAQVEGADEGYLRARLVEAYRALRHDVGAVVFAGAEQEIATHFVVLSPLYAFARAAARLGGALPFGAPAPAEAAASAAAEFATILGHSVRDIVKQAKQNARDPQLERLYRSGGVAEAPPGTTLGFIYRDPRLNSFAALYEMPPVDAAPLYAIVGVSLPKTGSFFGRREIALRAGGKARDSSRNKARNKAHSNTRDNSRKKARGEHESPDRQPREGPALRRGKPVAPPRRRSPLEAEERALFYESYRLVRFYARDVNNYARLDRYITESRRCIEAEGRLRRLRLGDAPLLYDQFMEPQQYAKQAVDLRELYDESGRLHVWGRWWDDGKWRQGSATYVYKTAEGAELELRGLGAVREARASGALAGARLVDIGCAVCGVRQSQTASLDLKRVAAAVRTAAERESFFLYYDARCPEGGVHAWAGGTCGKCGQVAGQRALDFYEKYAAAFAAERAALIGTSDFVAAEAKETNDSPEKKRGRHAAEDRLKAAEDTESAAARWAADYTLVVQAAEIAGVSPHLIAAIGTTEGRDYDAIAEGLDPLPPPRGPSDPRVASAAAEARYFLSLYSALRHSAQLDVLPGPVAQALVDLPKSEWGAMRQLDDVAAEVQALRAVAARQGAADMLALSVETICSLVVRLHSAGEAPGFPAAAAEAARRFAKAALAAVLENQRLLAKPQRPGGALVDEEGDAAVFDADATEKVQAPDDDDDGAGFDTGEPGADDE